MRQERTATGGPLPAGLATREALKGKSDAAEPKVVRSSLALLGTFRPCKAATSAPFGWSRWYTSAPPQASAIAPSTKHEVANVRIFGAPAGRASRTTHTTTNRKLTTATSKSGVTTQLEYCCWSPPPKSMELTRVKSVSTTAENNRNVRMAINRTGRSPQRPGAREMFFPVWPCP
jgi:hypothetical protein